MFPASATVLALVALTLNNRRDLGAGLIEPRPGPATRRAARYSPGLLAVRLQRGAVVGWLLALVAFGGIYGTLLGEVQDFAADNPVVQNMLPDAAEGVLLDSFIALIVGLIAMVASISESRWCPGYCPRRWPGSCGVGFAAGLVVGLVGAASVGDSRLR